MDLAVIIVTQVVNWPLAGSLLGGQPAAAPLSRPGRPSRSWSAAPSRCGSRVHAGVQSSLRRGATASLALLFAVYPDGRFVPRWIIVPAAIEIALQAANLASGLALGRQLWWPMHFAATWGLLIIGGQIHRYRSRSSVDERERTRWPLLAIVLMIFGFSLWSFVASASTRSRRTAPHLAGEPVVGPAGCRVRRRTARAATAARRPGAAVDDPVGSVVDCHERPRVGCLGGPARPGGCSAGLAHGAMVGVTAVPALWAARRIADLTVYGRRPIRWHATGPRDRLAASVDPRTVPVDIVTTVTNSLGLAGCRNRDSPALSATAGAPLDGAEGRTEYPIRYQGEPLAVLVVIPRPGDSTLTAHDRAMLSQICGQAAPALHSAGSSPSWPRRALGSCSRAKRSASGCVATCTTTSPPRSPASAWRGGSRVLLAQGRRKGRGGRIPTRPGLQAATRQLRDVAYGLRPPCSTTVVSSPRSRNDCRHREPFLRSAWLLRRSAWSCPQRSNPQRFGSSRRR